VIAIKASHVMRIEERGGTWKRIISISYNLRITASHVMNIDRDAH
jgi:hypothetical protein